MLKQKFLFTILLLVIILLAGCNKNNTNTNANQPISKTETSAKKTKAKAPVVQFSGTKGESVSIADDQIALSSEIFDDGLAHFYNTELPSGKTIYFFVVKDKNGVYRAAANACQVCAASKMGFRQNGNYMVCNTCGNKYPLEKIATEKGGCNPAPIDPNLQIKNGQVIIEQTDLAGVANFF